MYKMNRKTIGLAAAAGMLTLTGLTGCAAPANVSVPNVIQVDNAESNYVTVTGSEKVKVVPDVADIDYGVTTQAQDAESCQTQNAQEANKVIDLLKASGVPETSIQTNGFNLNPRYDWSDNKQVLIGYEMTTNITVTHLPVDQVGKLLNDSVNAGVNYISSVKYLSSKYDENYQEALKLTIAAARTKAEAMAEAGGRKLSIVMDIEEQRSNQDIRANNYMMAAKEAGAGSVDQAAIMPGELEVEANVVVKFSLE